MNQFSCYLIAIFCLLSCSDDDSFSIPDGLFIAINNDVRQPNPSSNSDYSIDFDEYWFFEDFDEPDGIEFTMDIYDPNRQYVGGIGGYNSCVEIEVFVTAYSWDHDFDELTYEVVTEDNNLSKSELNNKAIVAIRLKNSGDQAITLGYANPGQSITVERNSGEFEISFSNLTLTDVFDSSTFTASTRFTS